MQKLENLTVTRKAKLTESHSRKKTQEERPEKKYLNELIRWHRKWKAIILSGYTKEYTELRTMMIFTASLHCTRSIKPITELMSTAIIILLCNNTIEKHIYN